MEGEKRWIFPIIITTILLLFLAAGFWYKLSLPTQGRRQNQPPRVNKNHMFKIESPAFSQDEVILQKYTCDGQNINPPLLIENVPEKAKSLALVMDDPDTPVGNFNHWILWNIDPKITEISADSIPAGAVLGTNSSGKLTYIGPCPPGGMHRYFFKLYALDSALNLPEGAKKGDLEKAMEEHILEQAELMGKYERLR